MLELELELNWAENSRKQQASRQQGRENQALEQTRDSVLRYGESVGCELLNFFVSREDMTLETLKRLIETAPWFANLGKAIAVPGLVPVAKSDWQRFMNASTTAEFGLSHDARVGEKPPFSKMTLLPTANEEPDPIHGRALEDAAHYLNRIGEFKIARTEAFRLALASQRKVPEVPGLKVGATDSNIPARMAGRYACRMAASEIVVDQVGFWCDTVQLFHQGHWPLGRLASGEIVVF